MKHAILASLFFILLSATFICGKDQEIRTWTTNPNSSGKVFKAEGYLKEVSEDGKSVVLVINGEEKIVKIERLTQDDREYIEEFQEKHTSFSVGSQAGERKIFTVNGVDFTFCWCPSGEFVMGSPELEKGRFREEKQHRVMITKGFWFLETEVTQEMWESVMGTTIQSQANERTLSDEDSIFVGVGPHYPMYYVNWEESNEFCRKLSTLSGEHIVLPTEAQWEYACRAGSKTALYTGDIKILSQYNAPELDLISWYGGNSCVDYNGGAVDSGSDFEFKESQYNGSPSGTHEVKEKKPNAWGLYDMCGNIYEWCSDWYNQDYYSKSPLTDPEDLSSSEYRAIRGGSWNSDARSCRSAGRNGYKPSDRVKSLGFRPVLIPSIEGSDQPPRKQPSKIENPVPKPGNTFKFYGQKLPISQPFYGIYLGEKIEGLIQRMKSQGFSTTQYERKNREHSIKEYSVNMKYDKGPIQRIIVGVAKGRVKEITPIWKSKETTSKNFEMVLDDLKSKYTFLGTEELENITSFAFLDQQSNGANIMIILATLIDEDEGASVMSLRFNYIQMDKVLKEAEQK